MTSPSLPEEMSAEGYNAWQLSQYTEKMWQDWVVRSAEDRGWLCFHPYDSRRSQRGYPDLTCVHPQHGCRWLELKREPTKKSKCNPTPDQVRWLATLQTAGERAFLARPSDAADVERLLDGEDVWIGPRFGLDGC